jgi:dynein heavy chain 1
VEVFRAGEDMLERHRFAFPADWLYVENMTGGWTAFLDIFARKDAAITSQVWEKSGGCCTQREGVGLTVVQLGRLHEKVAAEDRRVAERIDQYRAEWESQRPVDGAAAVGSASPLRGLTRLSQASRSPRQPWRRWCRSSGG